MIQIDVKKNGDPFPDRRFEMIARSNYFDCEV